MISTWIPSDILKWAGIRSDCHTAGRGHTNLTRHVWGWWFPAPIAAPIRCALAHVRYSHINVRNEHEVLWCCKESMMASCSNLSSERSTAKSSNSRKCLPEDITDLLDVAIFTFSCQSRLRLVHKIWGDPVLEGASAFFLSYERPMLSYRPNWRNYLPPGWEAGRMAIRRRSNQSTVDACFL